PQDFCEMACSSPADRFPTPEISRSMTNFGMTSPSAAVFGGAALKLAWSCASWQKGRPGSDRVIFRSRRSHEAAADRHRLSRREANALRHLRRRAEGGLGDG